MYRLIIADDEVNIRRGLVQHISWEDMGFCVVDQFEDGKDVINYMMTNKEVDVILTDVQMFEVSGLEVAKWISEHNPLIKVVILSGYKEFDYVKEALGANVCDYLLKPLQKEELEKVFQKIKRELDEKKDKMMLEISDFFSYWKSEKCREVISCATELVECICAGKIDRICFREYRIRS